MAMTESMLGRARPTIGQRLWMTWERAIGAWMERRSEGVYRYAGCKMLVKRYHGPRIVCEDGTVVEAGDRIGELHLDNAAVLALTGSSAPDAAALTLARRLRASLRQIYVSLATVPELRDVKALTGVTLLHRGLVHGLGFERRQLASRFEERLCTLYLKLLLRCMHPEGGKRLHGHGEKLRPMMLVHTRASLQRRFDAGADIVGRPCN